MGPKGQQQRKFCFVTIGATASFDPLIKACFTPQFLEALRRHGYTNLLIQYGKEGRTFFESLKKGAAEDTKQWLGIDGFDFNVKGLGHEMRRAKGDDGFEGVVVSHAGIVSTFIVQDILKYN